MNSHRRNRATSYEQELSRINPGSITQCPMSSHLSPDTKIRMRQKINGGRARGPSTQLLLQPQLTPRGCLIGQMPHWTGRGTCGVCTVAWRPEIQPLAKNRISTQGRKSSRSARKEPKGCIARTNFDAASEYLDRALPSQLTSIRGHQNVNCACLEWRRVMLVSLQRPAIKHPHRLRPLT